MPEHSPSPTPGRAIYGFVLYLLAYVIFGVYLVWAYVPLRYLERIGLTYWPHKYWAVIIPLSLCIIFLLSFVVYMCLVCLRTPPLDSACLITDKFAIHPSKKTLPKDAIAPITDLSILDVNKILYLSKDKHD